MKLLIENQCLCMFLGITLFFFFFFNSNGGLIGAHLITLHEHILTQTLMSPQKSIYRNS